MAGLFSPFTLKDVTLRNRIGMSPMTMYRSVDGEMGDFHVMYLGARAAGGFALVFAEQIAIAPEGRTSVHCAGLYDDAQIPGHARVTAMIKEMGAIPAVQLGHTGRNGSEVKPWTGGGLGRQLPPDHPEGWQVVGPSDVPYGFGKRTHPVHALSVDEIRQVHRRYAEAARRAHEAGYQWLEMHFAHGYLAAQFFSPLANHRTDQYGGSLRNRARFLLEALDAVRDVWPERLPLTARLGCDDFHPDGVTFDESLEVLGWLKEHGLDLADLSMGGNTDDIRDPFFLRPSAWVERGARVRREIGLPVAVSWNLGVPEDADRAIRDDQIDVVLLGRPALSNPHWPVWAARELGVEGEFDLLPDDWGWWLRASRVIQPNVGWPPPIASKLD
ncbi:NADH:flavin oxidoreductase/NADH oxidase [Mycobacterium sp. M1]|uniref:NADH:flavin oxidoreductase/NADH oxidase n=1 Tax=Mycolicibacter acidiphilus TaxID=2835306 RepID=A0ABS5RMU4_9MYCO|nr:NADH:flavin oxidoreductase/NADH oxidase [Mycolicibacter acidiphilus]MBS9534801.1 NADH:flavin oxidoreductase/NADH oxidase [Mycolicibacter acidiphilus]